MRIRNTVFVGVLLKCIVVAMLGGPPDHTFGIRLIIHIQSIVYTVYTVLIYFIILHTSSPSTKPWSKEARIWQGINYNLRVNGI